MNLRYRVDLSQEERAGLRAMLSGVRCAARRMKRAQILLAADAGACDEAIAANVAVGGSTVTRTKRAFVEDSLEAVLGEAPRPGAARKLSGAEEALLVAKACAKPPAGRARWTLQLLADEMVALTGHDDLSRETVRRRLADNAPKPWREKMWCIPKLDAAYVARMEDVLDLYAEPVILRPPCGCLGLPGTACAFRLLRARETEVRVGFGGGAGDAVEHCGLGVGAGILGAINERAVIQRSKPLSAPRHEVRRAIL